MARSAAAAARVPGAHARRAPARKPARRASGGTAVPRKAATTRNARNAAALRKAAATAPRGSARAGALALPLPLRVAQAPFSRALRARGGGVLDALLHGRGWIALVGVLLAGIVFFNVDLLKLNRDIAATAQESSGVARENARLRLQLAKLDSSERIQRTAAGRGLLLPAPGDVRYLRTNPLVDAERAAKRVKEPSSAEPVEQTAPAPVLAAPAPTTAPEPAAPVTEAAPQATPPVAAAPVPQAQAVPQPGAGTTAAPTG